MNRLAFHGVEGEIKDSEKHLVAVHEAGHAIVALYLKPDKVSTATIIPQGQSKGHTRMIYDEEICCSENNDGIDDVANCSRRKSSRNNRVRRGFVRMLKRYEASDNEP